MTARDRAAKEAAAAAEEAARGKRRDELARGLTDGHSLYENTSPVLSAAIDRIIDTENELAKERAK